MGTPIIEILHGTVNEVDCRAISRLIVQVVPGFTGDLGANLGSVVQHPNSRLLVARHKPSQRIIGLAVLNFLPKAVGLEARLNDLVVDEAHRRQGYGSAIVDTAIQEARNAGAYKLEVTCSPDRVAVNVLNNAKFGKRILVNRYSLYFG